MNLVIDCWKNWNKLEGRASRKEYWLFFLSYILVMFFQVFLMNILGVVGLVFAVVIGIWGFFANISVSFRRLHDLGQPGWWILIELVPYIGIIIFLVAMTLKGTDGLNKYGHDPLDT
jgi:uncharacterized membrane protein YhaH (DUF805 family)